MKRLGAILILLCSGVLLACQLSSLLPTPEPSTAPRATRTKTPGSPASTAVPRATAAPTSAPAQAQPTAPNTPAPVLATAKENLRIRAAPSASAKQLGTLNKGDTAQITGRNAAGDWWQIALPSNPGVQAWISAAFVDVKGPVETVPVVGSGSTPGSQPNPAQPPSQPFVPPSQPYPGQPFVPIPPRSYP